MTVTVAVAVAVAVAVTVTVSVTITITPLLPSSVASPTIWSRYANIAMFIDCKNNQFLNK